MSPDAPGARAGDADRGRRRGCSTRSSPTRGSALEASPHGAGRPSSRARSARRAPRRAHRVAVTTVIDDLDAPPADAYDAYLRLHLLSHRLVSPHELNLDGIFGVLPNVAWTSHGPGRSRRR